MRKQYCSHKYRLHTKQNMAGSLLEVPTRKQKDEMIKSFMKDEESYTVFDDASGEFLPVICCVCDSIPKKPQWSTTIFVLKLKKLLKKCNMEQSDLTGYYPPALLEQCRARHEDLEGFVLSPETYVNDREEALICKECLSELTTISKKQADRRHPPKQAIANGYVIGRAPVELIQLNDVEISLISRVRTYCQSWIFFGGAHRHIKGWHTFFKNRPGDNVGNLQMLTESGMKGVVLVVLCGPFTTTQRALVFESVSVNPEKVVKAWHWLKENNFRYANDEIPDLASIPLPQIVEENM